LLKCIGLNKSGFNLNVVKIYKYALDLKNPA
jgi:hypothetical protein